MMKLIQPSSALSERLLRWPMMTALALTLCLFAPGALAQTTGSATLRGIVKDPTGAAVAGATVTLKSTRIQSERKVKSNSDGVYAFAAVEPGGYDLRVEATGFKILSQTGVTLSPGDNRGLDLTLEIGATSETVTISGTIEEIKTETGERTNTITAKQIENLSLISRNSLELLRILPGVVAPDGQNLQVTGFGDAASYNVNGQRGQNNNVSVDGSRVIDIGCNCGGIVSLNNDFVQEVTVQTSNFAAEHGNSTVQILGKTISGSSEFHGAAYTYVRHEALAANDRFRNYAKTADPTSLAGQKPPGRFYYPGGKIGGPIVLPKKIFGPLGGFNEGKDKAFFFVGFEVQRQTFGAPPRTSNVPTLKQRNGDFSEIVLLRDAQGNPLPENQQPRFFGARRVDVRIPGGFPNAGQVAPNFNLSPFINPIGKTLMSLYPLPNFDGATNNYISNTTQTAHRKDLKMKFDYKFSDNTNLFVRITRELEVGTNPYGIWWGPSTFELPTQNEENRLGRSVAIGLTKVINPTMTNEIVFSGSKLKLDNNYADPNKVRLDTLGLDNVWRLPFDNTQFGRQSPNVSLSLISWEQGQLWSPGTNPIFAYNDSFSITDNLTKVAGSHTLKFGALIEQGNKRQNFQGDPDSQGNILFNNWNGDGTGSDWGDLLVGQLTNVQHGTQPPIGNYRFYNYEFYAQDSWKLRPNFTLEGGVRISHMTVNEERKGFDILFSPSAYRRGAGYYINGDPFRPNGVLSASRGEIKKGVFDPPTIEFGPRLNFAWSVLKDDKLVVRGGAGIFYNRVQGNFQYDATLRSAPNGNVGADIQPGTGIPGATKPDGSLFNFDELGGLTLSNMGIVTLPDGRRIPVDPLKLASGGAAIISPDLNSRDFPTTYNASLSLATRLPSQMVLETAYVGTFGRHLAARLPINVVPLGAMLNGGVPSDPGSTIRFLADPNCDRGEVGPNNTLIRAGNCQIIEQTGVKADLSNPLHRAAVDAAAINKFRPFPDLNNVRLQQYTGTSNYHSLQMTLSRQTGKNLQFFATYTFSKVLGTRGGEFADLDPLDVRGRSYGVLNYDRTHIFNLSYNYNLPNLSPTSNVVGRALLNGWQMSGITTLSSGTPIVLRFTGDLPGLALAAFGSNSFSTDGAFSGAIAPVFSKNPNLSGKNVGEAALDFASIGIPAFGSTGPTISPFYFRSPARQNWDISLFKNFKVAEAKELQFRFGFFNIFNHAFPKQFDNGNASNSDINLTLGTQCVRTPTNLTLALPNGTVVTEFNQTIPNGSGGTASGVCDPGKGFTFTDATKKDFGKVTNKRGQRVIEMAVKFTF